MPTQPFLRLENIRYRYPGNAQDLLCGLHMDIDLSGGRRRIGLLGPNGSGKTTLFHIIMGLIKPDGGTVAFKGQALSDDRDFSDLRREVGLLFQQADDQLFSPTVLEDVAFGPLNLGLSRDQALERARSVLRELGLENFEDRITHKLSGGEKKMVALATILAMHPLMLLLDEPTNDLDPDTREMLITTLDRLPVSYLVISHDYDFLARTTDELLSLKQGRLRTDAVLAPHSHVHIHEHGDLPHGHDHVNGQPHGHPHEHGHDHGHPPHEHGHESGHGEEEG